ncbi:hypothetical protein [Rhodococcus opacus]|uniref:Uncharacterized protein n=1 Tax=Rhodococcus opacus M213 TaxID=1129896 RepID=K8XKQ6_RHOOP|nr:hypothetical protein WSS_A17391 [Rhodococcus opacus M213]ELB89156.1 hypothetical protein Rwratislav_31004 [Rhodococcus wratislaviensis IFP 2016]UDH01555.1 hypothetical protein K2Z90_007882 [Rhodococcus opacus PD630]
MTVAAEGVGGLFAAEIEVAPFASVEFVVERTATADGSWCAPPTMAIHRAVAWATAIFVRIRCITVAVRRGVITLANPIAA